MQMAKPECENSRGVCKGLPGCKVYDYPPGQLPGVDCWIIHPNTRPPPSKPVQVHHFNPRRHKIVYELFFGIITGIHLRQGPQLRIRPKQKISTCPRPLRRPGCALPALESI